MGARYQSIAIGLTATRLAARAVRHAMTTKPLKNRGMLSRLLLRDERVLAAGGLLAALTIVGGLGASAWCIYQTQQATIATARSERLDAAVQVLATGVQSILNAGQGEALAQVGAARRMVMEAAARHNLEVCRVELPDGTTLVDAAAKKGLRALPEVWPSAATTATPAPDRGLVQEIHMAGRGSARLLISAAPAEAPMLAWEVQLVIGAVGVVVLGAMLWTYRLLRGIRGVLAIREAVYRLAGRNPLFERQAPEQGDPQRRGHHAHRAELGGARRGGKQADHRAAFRGSHRRIVCRDQSARQHQTHHHLVVRQRPGHQHPRR